MDTKYFPMFHSYLETLSRLTDEQFGRVIRSALRYSVNGVVPDLDGAEAMAFGFIKMDVDRAREKYEAIAERNRVNGMKGGRPKKSEENPVGYLGTQKTQANPEEPQKPIEKEKEKEKEKENANERGSVIASDAAPTTAPAQKKPRKIFSPPTVEDVRAYCAENGLDTIDPEGFVDYYAANGWRVGNQPMKDWKATVRNWARRDRERGITAKPAPKSAEASFDTEDFFDAALQRTYGDNWKFFKEGGSE
jgi:hypothetical protein